MIFSKLTETINSLHPLTREGFALLLSCSVQKELSKGECLLSRGYICKHLYFVETGYLRSYIEQEGTEFNIHFSFEGSFLLNMKSLKTNMPSEHTIKAGENALVTLFEKDLLLEFYSKSLEIELLCRKILGHMVIDSNEQIEFYKLNTPAERYSYLIKNKPQMIRRIPVSQLSSYIGVARETLSRIRKNLT